jgi:hypothetical protein
MSDNLVSKKIEIRKQIMDFLRENFNDEEHGATFFEMTTITSTALNLEFDITAIIIHEFIYEDNFAKTHE